MVERGESLRFALESCDSFGVRDEQFGQHLEGHVAIEFRIARPIDLSHAAAANEGEDFVGAESGAGRQPHLISSARAASVLHTS
jgi:hypothetical protein